MDERVENWIKSLENGQIKILLNDLPWCWIWEDNIRVYVLKKWTDTWGVVDGRAIHWNKHQNWKRSILWNVNQVISFDTSKIGNFLGYARKGKDTFQVSLMWVVVGSLVCSN